MRKRAGDENPANNAWLISFADMATLLFAFMALIVAITAGDARPVVESEDRAAYVGEGAHRALLDASRLAPVIELLKTLDEVPRNAVFHQEEFRNAVFQLDRDETPDAQALMEAVKTGIEFVRDERGLVIKWDRALLFPEGTADLTPNTLPLLDRLAVFLLAAKMPISLESHTDPLSPLEGGEGPAAYELAMKRSRAVMEYLAGQAVPEKMFRLGAFGGARPRAGGPEKSGENARLEIMLQRPEPSSWRG